MTGAVSVSAPLREVRGARPGVAARAGAGVVLALCSAVSVGWLALGAVVGVVRYWPSAAAPVLGAAAAGDPWARAVVEAAPASEPLSQAVPDYAFSVLNLVLAAVLLASGRRGTGARTWPIRLLAVALVGSAGAFNLQAHAAARAIESATGLAVGAVHQIVLHGVACAAYILALLVFPTPSWDGLPGGRSARRGLALVGSVTFLLVGLGTALLPHTVSCVLFFGFLVPAVGLVVLPRRVRRGPGAEARIQARLLFSTLVGGFAVAAVLGVVTLLLWALDGVPGLAMVDPTTHSHSGEPVALLFWFSRLASAAIAVVVLVATRHDGLWTAERWFSRGLAVLLVTAVAGGGCVVLRTFLVGVLGTSGATAAATVVAALGLSPLYVRAERVVDRLLYGTRPAPYRVLADIAALSRSTLAPSPAQPSGAAAGAPDLGRVAEAVALGLGASVCRLTVRRPGLRDRTYEWTDRASGLGDRQETGEDLVEVPIRHGAEQVGVLAVDRQAVSGLNAQRDRLLVDIADGLGVVLEASRSGIELERQLRAALAHAEEIAVSRRRTVAEMDGERRRIERDLHDGAQHHLVSLRLTLGLVEHQVGTGAFDQAREWLGKLGEQLENAEAVLAATADGVSSLVLVEKGLVAALQAELDAAHPPVGFDDGGIPAGRRFPAEVEAAVWFCCAEAVGNARKHAGGAPVVVRLAERAGALGFTVRDEGPGFTPDPDGQPGRGLRNMTTRVSTVGGTVVIRSMPGGGTTVEGVVPLPGGAGVVSRPGGALSAAQVAEPLTVRITVRTAAPVAEPVVPPASERASVAVVEPDAAPGVGPEPVPVEEAEPEPVPVEEAEPEPVPVEEAEPEPVPVEEAEPEPVLAALVEPAVEPAVEPSGRERPGRLAGQVRELVRAACAAYRGGVGQDRADELAARLDEPVRIGVLATVDDGRRMLVEALVGTSAVPRPSDGVAVPPSSDEGEPVPVRYVFGDPAAPAGRGAAVVAVAAPALRAMTLVDVPGPEGPDTDPAVSRRLGPAGADRMRALLAPAGGAPVADAFVLLLHYGRPADLTLLDLLDTAGYRGAIGVLAVADDVDAVAERAVREYGDDPAVRRVCHSIVPVAPATAAAAARLGETEHRWLRCWVSATGDDAAGNDPVPAARRGGLRGSGGATTGAHPAPGPAGPEVATALLDRLGPLGARRALRLVRSGEGASRAELATALVRHSGLGHLQELIASRFLHRAEALRTRSVLAGLDALLRTSPPSGDEARRLRYQLEQIRAGAHELREIEFLDVLRSGDLRLPEEQLRAAERLLGADGGDVRARLGLAADATAEQVRAVATAQPARWRALADHPVASTRVREFAQVLVRTCERLAVEVDDDIPAMR